jgi:hypothetical protein
MMFHFTPKNHTPDLLLYFSVFAAAHGSLVGDLVGERVMKEGCTSAGRRMTLRQLVHAAPHLRDVVARDPAFKEDEDDLRVFREEMSKGASRAAATDTMRVRRFDVGQCVGRQWGRGARASLLAGVVRAHVMEEGGAALPLQVAYAPLIRLRSACAAHRRLPNRRRLLARQRRQAATADARRMTSRDGTYRRRTLNTSRNFTE